MNETMLQYVTALKLVGVTGYALLYGLGGIWNKARRRIWGSALLMSLLVGFSLWLNSFSWWLLLVFPLLWGATSIGYGADKTWLKIIKRSYCGAAYACATLPVFISKGAWELFALHTVYCLITSIWLGVRNPFDNARAEETAIGFIVGFMPLMAI